MLHLLNLFSVATYCFTASLAYWALTVCNMHKCYWLKKIIISSLPSYTYVIYMHTLPPVGTIMTLGSGLEDNNILCIILASETWPWPCSQFIGGEHDIDD